MKSFNCTSCAYGSLKAVFANPMKFGGIESVSSNKLIMKNLFLAAGGLVGFRDVL
jgi:hypothetical protein